MTNILLVFLATILLLTVEEAFASEGDRKESKIQPDKQNHSSIISPFLVVNQNVDHGNSLIKINAASDLADIQPGDWQAQYLQSLMQRYGVTETNTFRGNQAMTRYEFAASLWATINHIYQLIFTRKSQQVAREDLETLKRLSREFAQELKTLQGRVDCFEAYLPSLEAKQFSTTTKLDGEVLFAVTAITSGNKADNPREHISNNFTFSNRVRLNFNTSFTGKDRLRTRLQARNIPEFDEATGTDMARLAFQGNSSNDIEMRLLEYRFPIGEKMMVYLEAVGSDLDDIILDTVNPY